MPRQHEDSFQKTLRVARELVSSLTPEQLTAMRLAVLPAEEDAEGWLEVLRRAPFDDPLVLRGLFNFLSAEQRQRFIDYGRDPEDAVPVKERIAREAASTYRLQREFIEKKLERRTPKPRKQNRDEYIVRLHDEEDKSFGQIGALLKLKNPMWVGRDGGPLKAATVKRAYYRRKRRT
jgi:hypothetical protein